MQHEPQTKVPLYRLWTWLIVSLLAAFILTPADPTSMFIGMCYSLLPFFAGAVLTSKLHPGFRVLSLFPWIGVTVWLSFSQFGQTYPFIVPGSGIELLLLAIWAWQSIDVGRLRIFTGFMIGYSVGTICLGELGALIGAMTGTHYARNSLSLESPDGATISESHQAD